MNQITIRGLGPEIENKIRRMARDRHQSINYVLTEIIRQNFEKKNKTPAALPENIWPALGVKRRLKIS